MQSRRDRKRGGDGPLDSVKTGFSSIFDSLSEKAGEAKSSGLGFFGNLTKKATDTTSGLMGNTQPAQPTGIGGKRKKSKKSKKKKSKKH